MKICKTRFLGGFDVVKSATLSLIDRAGVEMDVASWMMTGVIAFWLLFTFFEFSPLFALLLTRL